MRIWKKTLKITSIIIVSIILFMILLVVGAKIFESDLASIALEKMEGEIAAPMSIGKVSLIPLFSFPRLSAEINDFWIGDPKSKSGDTLFFINSLKVGLDTWDLIDGIYTIDAMEISGLDFDYIIDKNGKSNIDFLIDAFADTTNIPDETTISTHDEKATPLDLSAEKTKLENIRINYFDSLTNTGAEVYIPEITLKAKTKNDLYTGKMDGSIILRHLLFDDTKVDKMNSCTVIFDLNFEDNNVAVKKMKIGSEGIDLSMEGSIGLGEPVAVDINFEALNLDFNILQKYIPDEYTDLFDGAKVGQMAPTIVNLNMDYQDNEATIKKLLLKFEGLDLGMEGKFRLSDTISMDANLEALSLDLDVLKKWIPNQYLIEYGILNVGGIADISATIQGKYADSTLLPMVDADVKLKNISLQSKSYPEIKTLNLTAHMSNGEKTDMSNAVLNINKLEVKTQKSAVQLKGSVIGIENPQYNISSLLDINLGEFKNYIPDSLAQNLQGNITASIKTSGILPETIPDDFVDDFLDKTTLSINFNHVSALLSDSLQIDDFSTEFTFSPQYSGDKNIHINNLSLKSKALNLDLENSSLIAMLSGKFADPLQMSANVLSFRFQNGENMIEGSAGIKNFETPDIDINTNLSLNLEELMAYTPDSIINKMTGHITANVQMKGKIYPDSLDAQLYPLIFEKSSFDFALHGVTLLFPDSTMNMNDISARGSLKNDILRIDDFSASYNGLTLGMDSTVVQNMYKAVLLNQKEELYIKTYLKFGDFIYDDFEHLMAPYLSDDVAVTQDVGAETPTDTGTSAEAQNWTYLIHGGASVNSFVMDSTVLEGYKINQLYLDGISALFKFTDSTYIVDQFKFNAFEGAMNNSFHYRIRQDGTQSVSSRNVIQNMNIRTMLRDMDNFGMDSLITYENLSGLLSTDLNMFIPIDDSVLVEKMMVSGDVVLEKGGVYNYKPAREISKLKGLKDLDNLQFKTLRSSIFMFKNKLYVPRTNIVSNEIDIAAFGMQSMRDDYEYHLEIHLSSILFGKSKKRNKKQDSSGEEIDEKSLKKSSHKIRYADIEGDSKAGWDTKASREEMMNKIRVQKKMLDFIFFPKNIHYNTEVPNLD